MPEQAHLFILKNKLRSRACFIFLMIRIEKKRNLLLKVLVVNISILAAIVRVARNNLIMWCRYLVINNILNHQIIFFSRQFVNQYMNEWYFLQKKQPYHELHSLIVITTVLLYKSYYFSFIFSFCNQNVYSALQFGCRHIYYSIYILK